MSVISQILNSFHVGIAHFGQKRRLKPNFSSLRRFQPEIMKLKSSEEKWSTTFCAWIQPICWNFDCWNTRKGTPNAAIARPASQWLFLFRLIKVIRSRIGTINVSLFLYRTAYPQWSAVTQCATYQKKIFISVPWNMKYRTFNCYV